MCCGVLCTYVMFGWCFRTRVGVWLVYGGGCCSVVLYVVVCCYALVFVDVSGVFSVGCYVLLVVCVC